MKCILLATDGSESAGRAADVAVELAKSMQLALWIVNVCDRRKAPPIEFSRAEHISRPEMIESLSEQILVEAKDLAEQGGAREVHTESREGDDVTKTIIEIAEQKRADAIVVGKRGHGSLFGLLVGSVTQKLVSLAPCTIIVVP